MSETHYWPGEDEPGFFNIDHECGLSRQAIGACWDGIYWILADENSFVTTRSLEERGFIGVRREKPEPEQVGYCWPDADQIGWHTVRHRDGGIKALFWNGTDWGLSPNTNGWVTPQEMIERGYLGVKKPRVVPMPILPIEPSEDEVIAKQALAELRLCRKPFETERWAYEWGPKLCVMLGAE